MAVVGVGVEGHIGLYAEFGHRGLEAADCSLDQALRVVGLGGLIVFFGRVAEEIDRRDAQIPQLAALLDQLVN